MQFCEAIQVTLILCETLTINLSMTLVFNQGHYIRIRYVDPTNSRKICNQPTIYLSKLENHTLCHFEGLELKIYILKCNFSYLYPSSGPSP